MGKIEAKLTNVPETMLIPLRARYNETYDKQSIINDPKSVEILNQIEYDFSGKKEVSILSQKGVAVRTEILDNLTLDFLKRNPDGTVVNFGCGLDTRHYRLNNNRVRWYDLDVPEAIELRKHFFEETDKFHFISKSIFDFTWIEEIPKDKPVLFIAEGLFMYFVEQDIKNILLTVGRYFKGAEIIFESVSPMIAKNTKMHSDVNKYQATFKWGIKTGKEIEQWNIGVKFINEFFYTAHLDKMPLMAALFYKFIMRKSMKIIYLKFE